MNDLFDQAKARFEPVSQNRGLNFIWIDFNWIDFNKLQLFLSNGGGEGS